MTPRFFPVFGIGIIFCIILLVSVIVVVKLIICWKIVSKAGYNGALSLLVLVPLVNLIMFIVFALAEWPIEKELKQLKSQPGQLPSQPMQ